MFMQFETTKNEKIIVGVNKILLIAEGKRGATVVLIDGTPITVKQNFEEVATRLNRRERLYDIAIED
ncbi:MAG: hypothetical protein J6U60_00335 [Clostridia bacterium]|nr:hypothetical protein [Clostridia bacterium]